MKPLKLYVWENVLADWYSGMAVALAESAEQAKELLIKSGIGEERFKGIMLDGEKPKVRSTKCAFHVHGGG